MTIIKKVFWFCLATIFLVEAWLWDRVQPVVQRIVAQLPLRRIKVFFRWMVGKLPPWAALLVMGIPAIVLLPAKFLGLWLLARGQFIAGAALFMVAKSVGFVLVVFLFEICRPKLLQLPWFVTVYAWFNAARAWAHQQMEPARAFIHRLRSRVFGDDTAFSRRVVALRASLRARADKT